MLSKISFTLMSVVSSSADAPSARGVAPGGRIGPGHVMFELTLDVPEQTAGAEAEQFGFEPRPPQFLVHEDQEVQRVPRLADAAGGLETDAAANQYGRIFQQGPGDGQSLALAARELLPSLTYHGVIPILEADDKAVSLGSARCFFDLIPAGIRVTEGDVLSNGTGEEKNVLLDDRDLLTQRF